MPKTIALIGTLDTKGPEIAYLRESCRALGLKTSVIDSGILGNPAGIEPDISREVVAEAAGNSIDALRRAGSRGAAVHEMMKGVRKVVLELYAQGRLHGVACLGGSEGAVLGAHAMQALPVGLPKLLATPIASGKRHFGPLMGLRDVMVIHSIVDILGLNPISRTIFDNMAAALAGMVKYGHALDLDTDERYVAITMLGNTTNELADELVGGQNSSGPERLRTAGRLGLPQVVVPGCIDFSVYGPLNEVPERLRERPAYTHNPVFTLVRTLKPEMAELGHRFAERLNEAIGPLKIAYPTQGLSIPNYPPNGVFWDPEADAAFIKVLRAGLRDDIPVLEYERHVNDPNFGVEVAELFLEMIS